MGKFKDKLASDIFTGYEGTITEASFQFGEYGGQMKFVVDEIDGREDPTWENYNIPPGWESVDGGQTITRVDGKDKGIVKSSQWGKFLLSVDELDVDDIPEEAMFDARPWIGTRWQWEVTKLGEGKAYKLKDKDTGETKEGVSKDKNYPVAFLGKDQSTVNSAPTGNGKVDNLSVLTDLHNPVVEAQIAESAKTLPYPAWFQAGYKAIQDAGIDMGTIPDLVAAMSQRALYESLGGKG